MAYELVQEVLDHAPEILGQAERLVLVCIAEEARRGSRKAGIAQTVLIRRTGLTKSGLQKVFQRLARNKIEVRVPLRMDKGRPVYAVPGTTCTYQIPALQPPKDCPCHRCLLGASASILQEKDGREGRGQTPEGAPRAPEGAGQTPGGTPTSPVPPTGAHRTIGKSRGAVLFGDETMSAKDAQESIRSALEKSPMRTKPLNGRRQPGSFEALLKYQVDTDSGGEPDAQAPEL